MWVNHKPVDDGINIYDVNTVITFIVDWNEYV